MLPHNVECVEVKQVRVPSRPRLQIFDDFPIGGTQQFYLFTSRVLSVPKPVRRGADGKLSMFCARMAVASGERIGENVQATPKTVDNEARFGVHDSGQWLDIGQLEKLLGALRIYLLDDFVWGELRPGFDSPFKNFELGVGPFNSGVSV
jgi:hypothetical protein